MLSPIYFTMITIALCSIPFVVGGIILWLGLKSAPVGFEDAAGFHLVTPKRKLVKPAKRYPVSALPQVS